MCASADSMKKRQYSVVRIAATASLGSLIAVPSFLAPSQRGSAPTTARLRFSHAAQQALETAETSPRRGKLCLAAGTAALAAGLAVLRGRRQPCVCTLARRLELVSCRAVEAATVIRKDFDVDNIDNYTVLELEEIYIDALWAYYRKKQSMLSDEEFDAVKRALYSKNSRFPTLKRHEVAFVEAALAYYRGEPVVSDQEYEELKAAVEASGKRKDVTAFLLYERGEQFLSAEQYASMKEEYEKMGLVAVNMEACNLAQLEEMYIDALWSYYQDGVQLLTDPQFDKLKQELAWQASSFPNLRPYEVSFVKASLAYWRGEPVMNDQEWEEVKAKVKADRQRKDVTAFLLYSKGQDVLDAEQFAQMSEEMSKIGVNVKRADSKALAQTLNVEKPELQNELGQVALMYLALSFFPVLLCIAAVWSLFSLLNVGALSGAVPIVSIGSVLGLILTSQLFTFLDLQDPELLTGVCPSCSSEIKLFNGGSSKVDEAEYSCKSCGCELLLDCRNRRIAKAGAMIRKGAKVEASFQKSWADLKNKAKAAPVAS
eukprot:TRINITY_DN20532_c1_g1_i1.p1 TRINITY_DN20532_c1_g1~~TRINITY_DN20532_c1_g1_i1.p1  ORF type:complete len:558 (-),score=120.83 TRINITY_DN20532_c1_g1_i1:95-1723(-)